MANHKFGKALWMTKKSSGEGRHFLKDCGIPASFVNIWEDHVFPSEKAQGWVTAARAADLIAAYENSHIDLTAYGNAQRPLPGETAIHIGSGWKLLITPLYKEWGDELMGELLEVKVSKGWGYDSPSLSFSQKCFVARSLYSTDHEVRNRRASVMMSRLAPGPAWLVESGRDVSIMMDNRPEFGVTVRQPRLEPRFVAEIYRISQEIIQHLLVG